MLAQGCPTPTGLIATSTAIGQVDLSWSAPSGPPVTYTYHVKRKLSTDPPSAFVTIATVSGLTYTDNIPYPFAGHDYEITAVSVAESGPSTSVSIVPMLPPPRTHKLGSRHMCGWSTVSGPDGTAVGAAALALAFLLLRRKI